jgi:single-strand selective monofunctional uracil DNA glycosylase
MQLEGSVEKPPSEIAARPVEGFNCTRAEQSGLRFWGLFQQLCGKPENFFKHCFVYNLCPLAFFQASGRNITPAELKGDSKHKLNVSCNDF